MCGAVACGDDDEPNNTPAQPDASLIDAGTDGATPPPPPPSDASTDTGVPGLDSGLPPTQPLTACPTHPNVRDQGQVCVITGARGNEIKQSLSLAPVTGKMGYLLQDGVFVGEDVGGDAAPAAGKATVTLTIAPGTKLFGASPLSFLLIQRGSKLEAAGTKEAPIVFTSASATPAPGQWGGLIINGRAPTNQGTNVAGEAETGFYGGPDAADNSGTLKYVRLEFTGGKVNDTNELNGVAFQGVGNGTTVDYVHVHASDDDAFEWFGGTVNAKHLVATAPGDDGLDWVAGYTGKIQYAIVQQWTRVSSTDPTGIEADNLQTMPAATPISSPTLSNITLIGGAGVTNGRGANLRRGTGARLHSSVVTGFNTGGLVVTEPETIAQIGTTLAIKNSVFSNTTNYILPSMATVNAAQQLGEFAGAANQAVAVGTQLLTDPTSKTPNFKPQAGSALLTGGVTPAGDAFFANETFIGAVGADDWTAGWVTITPSSI
ncbi:MAG: hypothetical protein ABW352_13710 [Polyangiales bacterium]